MFKHITEENYPRENRTIIDYNDQRFEQVFFYDSQGKIKIEEITTKGVVLASFNAG